MKLKTMILTSLLGVFNSAALANPVSDIKTYNEQLPKWGTSWLKGDQSDNGYYPSFYTGFAMRSEFPNRIHVRTARGNQTRVSVVLDQQTLTDYIYDLAARYNFYREATASVVQVSPKNANLIPQLSYFNTIIESPVYGILPFVLNPANSAESTYAKSLSLLKQLNPGRVFSIRLDLAREFMSWKSSMQSQVKEENLAQFLSQPNKVILALNTLVFGRINYAVKPTADVLEKLKNTLKLAITVQPNNAAFLAASLDLFKALTGDRYQIQILNNNNQFQAALQCAAPATSCTLSYPEFTSIYPTGSEMGLTKDDFDNRIPKFATQGLRQFLPTASGGLDGAVDNIRKDTYYGWIPKMVFEPNHNAFHNPAVRFSSSDMAGVRETLNLNPKHRTYWAVKRGGVSHGCLRLAAGHAWELRHIFPVENDKMMQVHFFGNRPKDFDLYDVDGDGTPEVMGVQYYISYNLQSNADKNADDETPEVKAEGEETKNPLDREGQNMASPERDQFYEILYGTRSVYSKGENDTLIFSNPSTSMITYDNKKDLKSSQSLKLQGNFKLYEQAYEQDKIQFYALDKFNTRIVRLMGRVRGCAPSSDKNTCGENAFLTEKAGLGL